LQPASVLALLRSGDHHLRSFPTGTFFMWKRLTLIVAILVQTAVVQAALGPEEVAIVALRGSKQSQQMAAHYAAARGIPPSHICLIDCSAGETLGRREWETKVRPAIRHWLASSKLQETVRCLVTVWDVPLKIGPIDAADPQITELKTHLDRERPFRQKLIVRLAGEIDGVLPSEKPTERSAPKADAAQKDYAEFLEAALKASQSRLQATKDQDPQATARAAQQLERFYLYGAGLAALLRNLQTQVEASGGRNAELVRVFDVRRGEFGGLRGGLNPLAAVPESAARNQQLLLLLQQTDGILGTLAWVEQQQELWKKNETYSSFDNELALALWPEYSLLRWQNNILHSTFDATLRATLPKTLIVARLEAPTFELTKQLVDSAVAVEKQGLAGKVYIDARGLGADKNPGSYGDYDQNLRDLGAWLKEHTALDIVIDNKDKLFQSGNCPDAALYCGWYSLANYVDAFTWKPGSVAYHIASSEADTLRRAGSNVWCKKMLEKGVCATLGPVYEPYLTAFPRPLDFFTLLLTGQFSLGEVYAATNPYTSWVVVLVGDPLYNPFKNSPQIDPENLPPNVKALVAADK
jgi:uncharacterized protein (TIGR03790 family)